MDLAEVCRYLQEAKGLGNLEQEITGFAIDSRKLEPGQLFFALQGEQVDGHEFLMDSLKKGAVGAVVSKLPEKNIEALLGSAGLILIPDVLKGLQQLALNLRIQAKIPVIGITGSNGKTTTKDLVGAVLETKYKTLKTKGNFNNEIGMPLTLLNLKDPYQVAVLEMGMRGLGQIKKLCAIGRPDYGIITNIGTAHYELLGSRERIAQAKGELLQALPADGAAVLNRDDPFCVQLGEELRRDRPGIRIIYYGFHPEADFRGRDAFNRDGGVEFKLVVKGFTKDAFLPLPGLHNVQNGLAALALGSLFEIPRELALEGLKNAKLTGQRLTMKKGLKGSIIIDDTYNANPASTKASLEVLNSLEAKRKIAVLGSHGELGSISEEGHRQIGAKAAELGLDYLLTIGKEAKWISEEALAEGMEAEKIFNFSNKNQGIQFLKEILQKGDIVLVKGSRSMALEEIVLSLAEGEGGNMW